MIVFLGRKDVIDLEWTGGELNRPVRYGASEGGSFREGPYVADTVMDAEEDVVFPVGSPTSATFGLRIVPPGQDFVEVRTIETRFPNRGTRVRHAKGGKAQMRSVG